MAPLRPSPLLSGPARWQILGLFGLAAAASLATLLGFGRMAREAREQSLIRERVREAGQILEKIDQGFAPFLDRQAARYARLVRGATTPTAVRRRLQAARRWLGRARSAISVHSIGEDGAMLFKQEPPGWYSLKDLWGPDTATMLTRIGLSTIAHWNDPAAARQNLAEARSDFAKSGRHRNRGRVRRVCWPHRRVYRRDATPAHVQRSGPHRGQPSRRHPADLA